MNKLIITALLLLCLPSANSQMFWSQNYATAPAVHKTQLYTDSFAYADSTDLVADAPSNWQYTKSSVAFEVKGNALYAWTVGPPETGNAPPGFAKWIGAGSFTPNQYATVTYRYIDTVEMGPAVRISGNSGYMVDCYSGGCRLMKVVSGVGTPVTSFGGAIATGTIVELDVTGTSSSVLTLTVGGISYQTYTDSSSPLTTGVAGVGNFYASSNTGSNFSYVTGGNLQ